MILGDFLNKNAAIFTIAASLISILVIFFEKLF